LPKSARSSSGSRASQRKVKLANFPMKAADRR
jgi:hypothetical protein